MKGVSGVGFGGLLWGGFGGFQFEEAAKEIPLSIVLFHPGGLLVIISIHHCWLSSSWAVRAHNEIVAHFEDADLHSLCIWYTSI
jgi:hypothetical protein